MPDDAEPIPAADRELILALATRLGMTEGPGPSDTLIALGDFESFYELVRRGNQILFEVVQRGHRSTHAVFASIADAVRFLVFTLADRRTGPEWIRIEHADFAPGSWYAPSEEGWVLRWPGGQAVSPYRRLSPAAAREFSWVATAAPADIAASYLHPNGEPLFDLGHRYRSRFTDPKPRTSTLRPRPPETPPPDPGADTETGTVLAAAAEIGWGRLPSAEGDVLTVGQEDAGRIIGYRHGMFEYRSFSGEHRTIRAAASTAAAARRLLVMETAAIARMRRRQEPTQLRVRGPAAGFTVTKGPTEFAVEGNGVRATFALGPVGQQQALLFTYGANASLHDILASYRNPTGAPLLDASR